MENEEKTTTIHNGKVEEWYNEVSICDNCGCEFMVQFQECLFCPHCGLKIIENN